MKKQINIIKPNIIKPLFKYIGGKSWLREQLREEVNLVLKNGNFNSYVEPFAGGLGSFLAVYDILHEKGIKNVILSDVNLTLINTYKYIQSNPSGLLEKLFELETLFVKTVPENLKTFSDKENIKKQLADSESFFKEIRKNFNINKKDSNLEQCARLVFLQKHSFNGVYRENSKGEYNTPFNWSGNTMLESIEKRIFEINKVFNLFNLKIENTSYENIVFLPTTLYYLDPPYLNEEINENKYNKDSFGLTQQLSLIESIYDSTFIYSNHYSETLIKKLKLNKNIKIKIINRKNIMSSDSQSRKNDKEEILASNIK